MLASGPSEPRRSEPPPGLRRLVDAYDVSAIGAVADALIDSAHLTGAAGERGAVMDLLAFLVEDPDTLAALEAGDTLPDDVLKQMADLVASDPPATVPEWELLQTVLGDVRRALGAPDPGEGSPRPGVTAPPGSATSGEAAS